MYKVQEEKNLFPICVCVCVCVCVYKMKYYSVITKNEIMPFAAIFMELEIIIFNEVSQIGEDKYHLTSLISGI